MKELEQAIMRRSAIEILFATIGLIIGLLISVMISFIFQIIGNTVLNHFVPVIVTIILGYLGFSLDLESVMKCYCFTGKYGAFNVNQCTQCCT